MLILSFVDCVKKSETVGKMRNVWSQGAHRRWKIKARPNTMRFLHSTFCYHNIFKAPLLLSRQHPPRHTSTSTFVDKNERQDLMTTLINCPRWTESERQQGKPLQMKWGKQTLFSFSLSYHDYYTFLLVCFFFFSRLRLSDTRQTSWISDVFFCSALNSNFRALLFVL